MAYSWLKHLYVILLCLALVENVRADNGNQSSALDNNKPRRTNVLTDLLSLERWESLTFEGRTEYTWTLLEGEKVLRAHSQGSASGYLLTQEINLKQFPFLNWRWRVEKPLSLLEETQKRGDDYAARIYVIVSGRWFFWQTKALNYVWSSRPVKGRVWPNAYAPDNARMMAIRDKTDNVGVWFSEKRHVLSDLQSWLGEDAARIDGIAIMTDSDDSQQEAIVYYADIFFSAD